jgi:Tfp pilus assembly protein PilF
MATSVDARTTTDGAPIIASPSHQALIPLSPRTPLVAAPLAALLARLLLLLLLFCGVARATPFKPTSDDQVLVRLPASLSAADDAAGAERRRQLARNPRQADLAAELAFELLQRMVAEGDPRFAGQAQAALAPWWTDPSPPTDIRVARAILRQFQHDFASAKADLEAVVQQDPTHVQAWSWLAAIAMVQTDTDRARKACGQLAQHASALQAAACDATVDAATGQARRAASTFARALADNPDAAPPLRLWVLTRLAETQERLGDTAAAERAYRQAKALDIEDTYLLSAYADFLLDQRRPAEVLQLLQGREANDLHLLRLALAGKATAHPRAAEWQAALAARFDAARARGDTAHQKEEARFALEVLGDANRALPLAVANYAVQREAADARVLLQAALAARQKAAATPVLTWLTRSGFESPVLQDLAARVKALP